MLKLEQRVFPPVKVNNSFKEPCDHYKMFISNMLEIQGIAHQQDHLKKSFGFIIKPTRMPTVPYDTISLLFSIRKMMWPLIRKNEFYSSKDALCKVWFCVFRYFRFLLLSPLGKRVWLFIKTETYQNPITLV